MGTRVYTWDEVIARPYPEKDTNVERVVIGDELARWVRDLQLQSFRLLDKEPAEFIIGCGQFGHFPEALTIMVTPGFDVSNHEVYPDIVLDTPIVYVKMYAPEAY